MSTTTNLTRAQADALRLTTRVENQQLVIALDFGDGRQAEITVAPACKPGAAPQIGIDGIGARLLQGAYTEDTDRRAISVALEHTLDSRQGETTTGAIRERKRDRRRARHAREITEDILYTANS